MTVRTAGRVKHTTTTSGVGTLYLANPSNGLIPASAIFGSGTSVREYVVSGPSGTSGPTYFEWGIGTFDGTSMTQTRTSIIASSNGGVGGSLVSLPTGTHDVIYPDRGVCHVSSTTSTNFTIGLEEHGNIVEFSGASSGTFNLPALASVPDSWHITIVNCVPYTLTIDPSGAETINGLATLAIGGTGSVLVYRSASEWKSTVISSTLSVAPVRHTVLSSALDGSGLPSAISAGSGLACRLFSSSGSPYVVSFSGGFGSGGAIDYVESYTVDSASFWSSLPANGKSFLAIDRAGAGSLTAYSTKAPPQYGATFNRAAQGYVALNNAVADSFGNTWTASNVTYSNSTPAIAGTYYAVFNGTSSKVVSDISSLGYDDWTIRFKVRPDALPGNNSSLFLVDGTTSGGYGVNIQLDNSSGTIRFKFALSSTGSSWDIANFPSTSTLPVVGTWYDIELNFDGSAYRFYVNGVQEASVTSSLKVCPFSSYPLSLGARSSGVYFFQGAMQDFEFTPYVLHPAGTSFTPNTALRDVTVAGYASDWFNIAAMRMFKVSAASVSAGTDPTFSAVNRVYVGEAVTGASSVSSVINYALRGSYIGSWVNPIPGPGVRTSKNHNIGTRLTSVRLELLCVTGEAGYAPGEIVQSWSVNTHDGSIPRNIPIHSDRNTASFTTGSNYSFGIIQTSSGNSYTMTWSRWGYRFVVQRGF